MKATVTPPTASETEKPSSQSSLSADDRQFVKDTRSYERNRQRLKNAMELVKRRARKARQRASAGLTTLPSTPHPSEKERRLRADDVDPLRDVKVLDMLESPISSDFGTRNFTFTGEAKLSDLIVTGRSRKVKDGDYEMIPRLRSVIVLDEVEDIDSELDEPWEHVLNEDKKGLDAAKKPSYAEIVSTK